MPPLVPHAPHMAESRTAMGERVRMSGTKLDKAALSQCFEDRPYTLLRVQRTMLFRVDLQTRQQTSQCIVAVVQIRNSQRRIAGSRRSDQFLAQGQVRYRRCKLGEEGANF